jgi:preprotein translocase subunit SecE
MSMEKDKPQSGKDQPKPARKPEAAKGQPAERRSFIDGAKEYFRSLKYEWLKVTFPTRKELFQSTTVVFIFTIALMVVISAYDALMSIVFNRLIIPPS